MKTISKNNRGMAMVMVIVIVAVLLAITGGALLFSGLNLRTASSLQAGVSAVQMADYGLQHAVATIPVGSVYTTFLTSGGGGFTCSGTCNGTTVKPTLTGSYNGYSYTVVAENDPAEGASTTTDVNKKIVLTVTATGPNGSIKRVQAYVGRSTKSWAPPGAFYFKGTTTNTSASAWDVFSGSGFGFIGTDTNPDGTAGPKPAIPAIATDNTGLRDLIKSQITVGQYPQVTGSGYVAGSNPSVAVGSTTLNVSTLITDILALGGASVVERGTGTYDGSGGVTFGTAAAPKITRVTGTGTLNLIGNFTGYGILIYDGDETNGSTDLNIGENAQFQGLIISTMHVHMDPHAGASTARVYGSMMMKQVATQSSLEVQNGTKLYYSSKALLDYVQNNWGSVFIQPAIVLSWIELVN